MNHWTAENRYLIFKNVCYLDYDSSNVIAEVSPKIQSKIEKSLLTKIRKDSITLNHFINSTDSNAFVYYRNAGGRYWRLVKTFPTYFCSDFSNSTTTEKSFRTHSVFQKMIVATLSSSLFYWYWRVASNCRHLTNREIDVFPVSNNLQKDDEIGKLCDKFEASLKKNKKRSVTQNKTSGEITQDYYYVKQSKPIIDEIDKVLAKHYGFTEEELDFIINYDIKYRMGDELGGDE